MSSDIYRDSIFWVEVERIKPNPFQPRREFDKAKLDGLAESIRMYGLLQPLTVTRKEIPHEDGGISVEYELIAGERRLRASKLAGIQQLPVIIRSGEDDDQVKLELAIIENLQREDLNPVDRARAFQKLYKEFGFTHAQIGKKMGKSREYVSNTLRLLSLPEAILGYIIEGRITEGHTRPLMMLNNRPEEQTVLAREILLKKLTVRETEAIARRAAQDRVTDRHKIDPEILSMEQALTEKLGTRVQIEPREVGGRLVISFFSADDLQTLLDSMRVEDERAIASTVFDGMQTPAKLNDEEVTQDAAAPEEVSRDVVEEVVAVSEEVPSEVVEEVAAVPEEVPEEPVVPQDGVKVEDYDENIFDSFMKAIMGDSAQVKKEESTADADAETEVETKAEASEPVSPTGVDEQVEDEAPKVSPSPERPMPETATPIAQEPVKEKKEDDSDLYSIRNFSI